MYLLLNVIFKTMSLASRDSCPRNILLQAFYDDLHYIIGRDLSDLGDVCVESFCGDINARGYSAVISGAEAVLCPCKSLESLIE